MLQVSILYAFYKRLNHECIVEKSKAVNAAIAMVRVDCDVATRIIGGIHGCHK